jgi:hypothetical protein
MFQSNFSYLSLDDIDMTDICYNPFETIYQSYDSMSESSLDNYDLDPDYMPDTDDSSNEYSDDD